MGSANQISCHNIILPFCSLAAGIIAKETVCLDELGFFSSLPLYSNQRAGAFPVRKGDLE